MVYLLADTKNFVEHAETVSFICYTLQQRITEAEALALIRSHIPTIQKEWRHNQQVNVKAMTDEGTRKWVSDYLQYLVSTRKTEDLTEAPFYQAFYRLQLKGALAKVKPFINNKNISLKELSLSVYDFYKTPDNKFIYLNATLCVLNLMHPMWSSSHTFTAVFTTLAVLHMCLIAYEQFYDKPKAHQALLNRGAALYQEKIREIPKDQKGQFPSVFNASGTKNTILPSNTSSTLNTHSSVLSGSSHTSSTVSTLRY